jgi:hypothetical protein
MTMREKTLDAARDAVMRDRNLNYGCPEKGFQTIAHLWNVYLGAIQEARGGPAYLEKHDVAVLLDLVKTARIVTSPDKHDHWVDKAGYAACGAECAVEEREPERGTWGGDPAPAGGSDAFADGWAEAHAEWLRQQRVGGE